jgi:Flp pilus assembly protein TadG
MDGLLQEPLNHRMHPRTQSRCYELEKGQVVVAFVVLIPVLIMALFVSLDLGRYQIMRNQARIAADSAASAAAGALDLSEAAKGNFVLNEAWAQQRAYDAVAAIQGRINEDSWMTISLTSVQVNGAEAEVTINGTASAVFGGLSILGVSDFDTSVVSKARAATGVDTEW